MAFCFQREENKSFHNMLQKKSHHFSGCFVVMFVVVALLSQSNIFFYSEIQGEFDQILTQLINVFDSPFPEV